jgi:hypothetical protein
MSTRIATFLLGCLTGCLLTLGVLAICGYLMMREAEAQVKEAEDNMKRSLEGLMRVSPNSNQQSEPDRKK